MSTDVRARIVAANRTFMEAFNRGDTKVIGDLYTHDAQLLPANSDFVRGIDAIRAFWAGAVKMGLSDVVLDTIEVEAHGDTAIEVGRYTLQAPGGAIADAGKYLVVWKNDGRAWKLHRDIWTTSQPAAVPSA